MSDFGDAVRSALTEEWQDTNEITMKCPRKGYIDYRGFRGHVYHYLRRMVRDGIAEVRTVGGKGRAAVINEWRLKP